METQVMTSTKESKNTFLTVKQKQKIQESLKYAGLSFGGAGIAMILGGFTNIKAPTTEEIKTPDINNINEATTVNDGMSFSEAFATARAECGPNGYFVWHGEPFNTLYDEELNAMSEADKTAYINQYVSEFDAEYPNGTGYTPVAQHASTNNTTNNGRTNTSQNNNDTDDDKPDTVVIVHETAPVYSTDLGELAIEDAFAVARQEVGAGGLFLHNGKYYSTYTNEELQMMTPEMRNEFAASVLDAGIEYVVVGNVGINESNIPTVIIPNDEIAEINNSTDDNENGGTEVLIDEQYVTDDNGNMVKVGIFEINGERVCKVDNNNDGIYDNVMRMDNQGNIITEDNSGNVIESFNVNEEIPYEPDVIISVPIEEPVITNTVETLENTDELNGEDLIIEDSITAESVAQTDIETPDYSAPTSNDASFGSDFDNNANTEEWS